MNCPDYIAKIERKIASTLGTLNFLVIDISLACEAVTSSWILDSVCPVHIYNSLQTLNEIKQLKHGEMQLRFVNGYSLDAVAVRVH